MGLARSRLLSATSPSMTERVGTPPNPYTVSVGYASNPPPLTCSSTESRVCAVRGVSRTSMTLGVTLQRPSPRDNINSARSRSSGRVIFRFFPDDSTITTWPPTLSTRDASSVAGTSSLKAR